MHRGAGNFVAVQMQNRQHRAIARGIQKLDALPASLQRTRLSFAVADHARHDQIGIVERRPESVHQRIAQFPALVHGVRRVRPAMAGNPSGSGKRAEQKPHAVDVLRDLGMHIGVCSFEVRAGVQRRAAMAGAGNVNHIRVGLADQPVQMHVNKILPGGSAPVPQQPRLDVFFRERLAQQRIIQQIDLADAEIIRGAPIALHLFQQFGGERAARLCCSVEPCGFSVFLCTSTAVDKAASNSSIFAPGAARQLAESADHEVWHRALPYEPSSIVDIQALIQPRTHRTCRTIIRSSLVSTTRTCTRLPRWR